eukprot:1835017-Prymnesium_polylepis.2
MCGARPPSLLVTRNPGTWPYRESCRLTPFCNILIRRSKTSTRLVYVVVRAPPARSHMPAPQPPPQGQPAAK